MKGIISVSSLSNQALWRQWKESLDYWAAEPHDRKLKERVDKLEDEIVSRLSAVGHGDCKADFVSERPGRKQCASVNQSTR